MLIHNVKITNFRCYYGTSSLTFNSDGKITLIYGDSGYGKSSFLQFFRWMFYGDYYFGSTDDKPLFNIAAYNECKTGESVEVSGQIDFEHLGVSYRLNKTQLFSIAIRMNNSTLQKSDWKLQILGEDGGYHPFAGDLANKINSILPKELSKYFLLDGERSRDIVLNSGELKTSYCFSALSASIDGEFCFEQSELDENIGVLKIDMSAVLLINDGQHRKAAIEAALKEDSTLSSETISIVLFKDEGLKRSQQMFADLNKHAVKPSKSLSTLYDGRDDLSNAVKEVVSSISFLNKYVDKERDTLGKYSSKLFTLSNFLRANQRIIKGNVIAEGDRKFLIEYWTAVISNIPELTMLESKQLYKYSLKEEYVLTLSVLINALGRLGYAFYYEKLDLNLLRKLSEIDWMRNNPEWVGRVFNEHGKIIGNFFLFDDNATLSNYIKKVREKIFVSLKFDMKVKETLNKYLDYLVKYYKE